MPRKLPKYVNAVINKNRPNPLPRWYLRKPGCDSVRLPGLPWSEEFMRAHAAALAGLPVKKIEPGSNRTKTGTVADLIARFFERHWEQLRPTTQKTYRRPIEDIRKKYHSCPIATLRTDLVEKILEDDCKDQDGKSNLFTKLKLQKCWRLLMKAAKKERMRADDPTLGLEKIKLPTSEGHHAWEDWEIERFRSHWPLGTQARLVFEFALETYSRRSEVLGLGPQHISDWYDEARECWERRIKIARVHGSESVDIIVTPELGAAIDAMPKPKHLTYLVDQRGKPMSDFTLSRRMVEWVRAAGLPDKCRLHGLKKAGMNALLEDADATTAGVKSLTGHKSTAMVDHYTKKFNKRKVADNVTIKLLATRAERARRSAARPSSGPIKIGA